MKRTIYGLVLEEYPDMLILSAGKNELWFAHKRPSENEVFTLIKTLRFTYGFRIVRAVLEQIGFRKHEIQRFMGRFERRYIA